MRYFKPEASVWRRIGAVLALAWTGATAIPSAHAQQDARIEIGGAVLDVHFSEAPEPGFRQETLAWIDRAAKAVTVYYAQFPVKHVEIAVHVTPGSGIGNGNASGYRGPHINVRLGSAVSAQALAQGRSNWLMTHEMVHLALSGVQEQHHWLEEGLATYVEPVARVRAGELDSKRVWRDMLDGLPQGEPGPGDLGLDRTPTWGRTYWGGALFCLLADVEIRKQTHNKMGLETALRGIVAAGGTIDTDWGLERVLKAGDDALGLPVLGPLYNRLKDDPSPVDLPALWNQLGIEEKGETVVFHDDAPLAAIRTAIMAP